MFDGEAFGQQMVEIVRGYVDAEIAPLKAENAALRAMVERLEARELPLPEKGEKGEPGEQGPQGEPGEPGKDGKDGAGLADVLKDGDGNLVLVMTDGRTKSLGPINGKDGEPGRDGVDGITPEFMDADFEGRTLRLTFGEGERTKTVEFQMATPEYRGVFKDGESYERGDMVTWGGDLWHAERATSQKPATDDWRLAVRKGRDAK